MRRAPPPSPSPSPSRWGFWETERLLGAPRAAHGSRPDRLDGGGFYPPFQPLRVEPRRYPEWRKSAALGGGGGGWDPRILTGAPTRERGAVKGEAGSAALAGALMAMAVGGGPRMGVPLWGLGGRRWVSSRLGLGSL
jgi:hypothetical protein